MRVSNCDTVDVIRSVVLWHIISGMRKLRENRHNRVYHLISRIAHRSFYLDVDELQLFGSVNRALA